MASFHCTSRRCDGTIAASSIATRAYFLPRPGSSVLCSVQKSITPPVVTSRRFFWLSDRVMIGARTLLTSRHTSSKYFSFGANHATGLPASIGRTRRLMSSSVLPHRLPHTSTLNLRASWMTSSWAGWGRRSSIRAVWIAIGDFQHPRPRSRVCDGDDLEEAGVRVAAQGALGVLAQVVGHRQVVEVHAGDEPFPCAIKGVIDPARLRVDGNSDALTRCPH